MTNGILFSSILLFLRRSEKFFTPIFFAVITLSESHVSVSCQICFIITIEKLGIILQIELAITPLKKC